MALITRHCFTDRNYQSEVQYWLVYDLGQSVVISHLQIAGTLVGDGGVVGIGYHSDNNKTLFYRWSLSVPDAVLAPL